MTLDFLQDATESLVQSGDTFALVYGMAGRQRTLIVSNTSNVEELDNMIMILQAHREKKFGKEGDDYASANNNK